MFNKQREKVVLKRGRRDESRMSTSSRLWTLAVLSVTLQEAWKMKFWLCFCKCLKHCCHLYSENLHSYCNVCVTYVEASVLEFCTWVCLLKGDPSVCDDLLTLLSSCCFSQAEAVLCRSLVKEDGVSLNKDAAITSGCSCCPWCWSVHQNQNTLLIPEEVTWSQLLQDSKTKAWMVLSILLIVAIC